MSIDDSSFSAALDLDTSSLYELVSLLTVWDKLSLGISVMLSLRAFKRALVAPMLFSFEVQVALITMNTMKDNAEFFKFWLH